LRGKRSSISKKKLDVILEAVRFDDQTKQLQMIRGFRRRGVVWGDWELFERADVVEFLQDGMRVATGRPASLQGDFEIIARVRLDGSNGDKVLLAEDRKGTHDDLDLPRF
jgi:hypothetical protein